MIVLFELLCKILQLYFSDGSRIDAACSCPEPIENESFSVLPRFPVLTVRRQFVSQQPLMMNLEDNAEAELGLNLDTSLQIHSGWHNVS
jgi:hypothetical protein